MKQYYIFILLAICAFFVASCDIIGGSAPKKEVDVKRIVELPDTVKQHLIKQDSLYTGLIAKIDTLTNELNAAQQNVAQLQKKLEELENPKIVWNYMTVGAIILSLIAVFLTFRRGGRNEDNVRGMVNDYLNKSRLLNELQSKVLDLEKVKNSNSNPRFMQNGPISRKSEDRISYLEEKLKEVLDILNRYENEIKNYGGTRSTPGLTPLKPKLPELSKDGYAKLNSGAFFFEILDSNQEGCVFHISFKSENKGEFDIISLDKIKSRNGWQEVVEINGDCTIEDATTYKVMEKGICEKHSDGKTWKMIRKLKIKISK